MALHDSPSSWLVVGTDDFVDEMSASSTFVISNSSARFLFTTVATSSLL